MVGLQQNIEAARQKGMHDKEQELSALLQVYNPIIHLSDINIAEDYEISASTEDPQ
jgi:hypothetical protein